MSTELVKSNTSLVQAGQIDTTSKLFRLKPATLTINQGNTQVEGAIPGHLRVLETGEQFKKLTVVMLAQPKEPRFYHFGNGEPGNEMNKKPENLACFSWDRIKPDPRSKQEQAITCASCPLSKWNNDVTPGKPPLCDEQYYIILGDTETQIPLRMYIKGSGIKTFEAGMQNWTRTYKLLHAKGKNPTIYNISFDLSSTKLNKNGKVIYAPSIDPKSFKLIGPEEAEEFGAIYQSLIYGGSQDDPEEETAKVNSSIDAAISGTVEGIVDTDGAIVI